MNRKCTCYADLPIQKRILTLEGFYKVSGCLFLCRDSLRIIQTFNVHLRLRGYKHCLPPFYLLFKS